MSFLKEFRAFAVKGNVIDLAVGVIIGGVFGKIVTSVVEDLVMPIVGLVLGKVDFANLFIPLAEAPVGTVQTLAAYREASVPVIAYGNFITTVLNFIIMAFVIFLMIRQINKLRKEKPTEPEKIPEEVLLLRDIRDNLKSANNANIKPSQD